MDLTVTQYYESRLGPFETICVEVLNDRYGRITTTRLRKTRNYAIELATLAPEPRNTLKIAWQWLAAALASLAALLIMGYYVTNSSETLPLPLTLGGGVILLALTLLFTHMFISLTARHIIFLARFSGTPLVEIPIPVSDRKKGKAFAEVFSQLAQKNRARLHHTDEDMRAGELRMLRRLSEEGAINDVTYDKAKRILLNLAT